jgi:hypothetical protein
MIGILPVRTRGARSYRRVSGEAYRPRLGAAWSCPSDLEHGETGLRRARSKGVGLFLATQSPGDLDYKCRDQICTWLVGRVKEKVAIDKLRPMLEAARIDAAAKLPGQEMGHFYLIREKEVLPVQIEQSLIPTAQVAEDRILELARTGRPKG